MVLTVTLAALLAQAPVKAPLTPEAAAKEFAARPAVTRTLDSAKSIALDLHPMTEEEKKLFPGRERFDKTEWYESLFKSMKIVLMPEHVDEWNNGGRETA
jgi:hypothetical protein